MKTHATASAKCPLVVGIDVGLANSAIAVIKGPLDADVVALEFIGTDGDKSMRQMRDDFRRTMLIVAWVVKVLVRTEPDKPKRKGITVIVEWYAPRFPQKRGWTTSIVVGAIATTAAILGFKVIPAKPPLHVQVATPPVGHRIGHRAMPHVLDALTHARLFWHANNGSL